MSDPSSHIAFYIHRLSGSQPLCEVGSIIVPILLIRIIQLNKAVYLVNVKH